VRENFIQIRQYCDSPELLAKVGLIEQWSEEWLTRYADRLLDRKNSGFVRECHGDLHCHNLAWYQGKPLAFDCIEFDPALYWIDVISDVAFLIMDLRYQQRDDLALIFLNRYLQVTGDYHGLTLVRFYMVYRAMVRAKIEAITAAQPGIDEDLKKQSETALNQYLNLAEESIQDTKAMVLLMHGPSASGKSTVSSALAQCLSAITVRSDVERKRLFGIKLNGYQANDFGQGIYSTDATEKTYQRMLSLTKTLIRSGFTVINDATFSQPRQRQMFYDLADQLNCPVRVIDLQVSESILRKRIERRKNDVSDADIHVLERQLKHWQPLTAKESPVAIVLSEQKTATLSKLCQQLMTTLKE
jgi:predicted kinase